MAVKDFFRGRAGYVVACTGLLVLIVLFFVIPTKKQDDNTLTIVALKIWSDPLNAKFEQICAEYEKQYNVKVRIVHFSPDEADSKLASFINSDTGGDLAVFPAQKISIYNDQLMDLTDVANDVSTPYGGFYPIASDMTTVQGRYYGLPLYSWCHLWIYDGALLKRYNLQPANTFDEAEHLALALKKSDPNVDSFGIGMGKDDDTAMFLQSVMWAYGASIVGKDGKTITIDSKQTRQALSYVIRLYRDDKVIPAGAFGWDGATNNTNFLAKRLAFTMNSPTILLKARENDEPFARSIVETVYPSGPVGRFSYGTGFAFGARRSNPKRHAIEQFLRFLYSRDNYRDLLTAGGGAVNPWLKGCEDLPMWKDPQLKPCLDSLQYQKPVGWPGPVTPAASQVFDQRILAQILSDVINNHMTLDDAIDKAERNIRDIYATNGVSQ